MQARATPRIYFCVEVVRKPFADKPIKLKHSVRRKNWKKKREKREKAISETSQGWRRVLAILSWKMGRSAQLQPKRQPSQGRQLLLLNTKRPENRGSRQIFCPTQPVRAQIFRHVRELWTWSIGPTPKCPCLDAYSWLSCLCWQV